MTASRMYAIKVRGECIILSFKMVYCISVSLLYMILIPKLTLQAKDALITAKGF